MNFATVCDIADGILMEMEPIGTDIINSWLKDL